MKKKYKTGGPLTTAETSAVKIIPNLNLDTTKFFPSADLMLQQFKEANPTQLVPNYPNGVANENYSKKMRRTKEQRIYEKSLGGQLLQTGVSFIPGVGQVLAPLVGMVDQQMDADKLKAEQVAKPQLKINNNPYGSFKNGGVLNDMFKQYHSGSHASGNDTTVDANGDVNPNGVNKIQNKENSYKVGDTQYVFSDTLTMNGKKFSEIAAGINKKYSKARTDLDQRTALDLEMKQLSKKNESKRVESESTEMAYGGPILGKAIQQASDYWKNAQFASPDQVPPASENQFVTPHQLAIPGEYQGIEMATDTTQMPGGNPTELKLGQNLAEISKPSVSRSPIVANTQSSNRDVLSASTANGIGLVSKGLALAGSINDAMQNAEREKLILPDYTKADRYVKSANIDYTQAKQDAIGVSNIGGEMNRSLSGNAAQFQGREQARLAQLQDAIGRVSEAENNATSQLNMTKGNYEQGKAVDTANREYQNQQGNMQNDANQRFFGRQLASDLSQIGSSFNEYAETTKLNKNTADIAKFTNSQIMATINAKNPNFKLDEGLVQNFIDGKTSLDDVLTFVPNESKEEVKKILIETKTKN
jgi:hypothetical protein